MRVAHLLRKYVPAEWGGTETALQGLAEGLAANGVRSVAFAPAPETVGADPLVASGCEVRRFRACVPVWGLSPATRRQMLSVGGNLLSFDLPWLLWRERELGAIHTHALGRIGGIAGTVARRRNLPFVVTIHGGVLDLPATLKQSLNTPAHSGVEWGRLFGWWWRARHVLAEADAILTCNSREADLLHEQYPDRHIVVQPHGVRTERYRTDRRAAARAAFPVIAGRDILLTVARIDPVKNQIWLVRQLPRIVARRPRILLVLTGACTTADYGVELHREIARLGLADHVLLTGGLPPGDPRVVGLMQEARVAILPSLAETFGLVILEAWATGLGVLATRSSGACSLVRDGENGCLYTFDEAGEFHAKLDRMLDDPAMFRSLTAAGSQAVLNYDLTRLAARVKDLYVQLSEEKHPLRHSA